MKGMLASQYLHTFRKARHYYEETRWGLQDGRSSRIISQANAVRHGEHSLECPWRPSSLAGLQIPEGWQDGCFKLKLLALKRCLF